MTNPFKQFTRKEWMLWEVSLAIVIAANLLSGSLDILTLIATCVGVTALIFTAKGNAWAMVLMIIFSILYGVISWRFRYWGEMITYMGMSMPMSAWALYTWLKHPSENGNEVAVQKLDSRQAQWLELSTIAVTAIFYFILKKLNTPNLIMSTLSITTSFLAAALTMLRSSYYALVYAANDLILIVLWMLASVKNPVYIPVAANFAIFFINDMYGYISWKKREAKQSVKEAKEE